MKFIGTLVFAVAIPWLLFKLALWFLIPFFGITNNPTIAAVLFASIPCGISLVIAACIGGFVKLPDN